MDIFDTPLTFGQPGGNDAKPRGATGSTGMGSPAPGASAEAFPWSDVIAELGADVATPLTSALERVVALTTTGKIDRAGLKALRNEIEYARNAAVNAQQLNRLAKGRLRQSHERLQLSDFVQNVLEHRGREAEARGLQIRPRLGKVIHLITDAALLFNLVNHLLDWALHLSSTPIDLEVDQMAWPPHGILRCSFSPLPPDRQDPSEAVDENTLNNLSWRLVQQIAVTMKIPVKREIHQGTVRVSLQFTSTVGETLAQPEVAEQHTGFSVSQNSQPLAGSHVLVVIARRDLRTKARDAIASMGLIIDLVGSVDEAIDFCSEGLPHAIIIESALLGPRFRQFMQNVRQEIPNFPFVEITEDENPFELSGFGSLTQDTAQVGRPVIDNVLADVLKAELTKNL